jgi:putative acetyltransferase
MLTFEAVEKPNAELIEKAKELFREYATEVAADGCFGGFNDELESLPGQYSSPTGCLLLLNLRGQVAGCGAYRHAEDGSCELKRIYVVPDLRGMGFGRMLTEELLKRAVAAGYRRATLDTLTTMHAAHELYRSLAFKESHRVASQTGPGTVYMERDL